ncbi:MAG: polyphosphate kinase 1 [Planctomycetota bacterium]
MKPTAPAHFQNREIAWLDFNGRVLAEAERRDVPLLERVKFLAIVSGNLDEFFMIRVSMLHRALEAKTGPLGPDGLTPAQTLRAIAQKTHTLVRRQYRCLDKHVLPSLAAEGIHLCRGRDFTPEDMEFLASHFDERLFPVLTPLAVDRERSVPLLVNCALYILFRIAPSAPPQENWRLGTDTVLVQVPTAPGRFIRLPSPKGSVRVAPQEEVVIFFASRLLRGYAVEGAHPFRVTRDADIQVDDEQADDFMRAIQEQLRSRRKGEPVRLEISAEAPGSVAKDLQGQFALEEQDVYRVPGLLDMKGLFSLLDLVDRPDLCVEEYVPQPHPRFLRQPDPFALMRERDLVLHHPYHAFQPVVDLLQYAADDPAVLAIKIALYRVSGDSPLVEALVRAAENGKSVTVVVELRARFDEERNIAWAQRLDEAGAHVIYGVVGFKVHAKALLVVRQEPDGIRRYVHLSTGNYNDRTARLYTDIGYFTSRPEFGADISAFFNVLTGYSLPPRWNRIAMAPTGLRDRVLSLIDREIEHHAPETPGLIRVKLNALTDPRAIEALYRASAAGVRVDLLVRGICRLRAGVPGLSENIRVRSIVDRFLEHARILHLHNGGNDEVYLSSADWMERNFDARLEIFYPILDPEPRSAVLAVLDAGFRDNTHAWERGSENRYARLHPQKRQPAVRSQELLFREAGARASDPARETRERLFVAKRASDDRKTKKRA